MPNGFWKARYLRRLVLVVVVIVVVGIGFLTLWYAIARPEFDQRYALNLLARHDPSVSRIELEGITGANGTDAMKLEWVTDPVFNVTRREVWIENEAVIINGIEQNVTRSAELATITSTPLDIGPINSSWRCPFDTWLNVSIARMPTYLYLGTQGTWMTAVMLLDWMSQHGGVPGKGFEPFNATDPPTNITVEMTFGDLINTTSVGIPSQLWYFNPDEAAEFDEMVAGLYSDLENCTEVVLKGA